MIHSRRDRNGAFIGLIGLTCLGALTALTGHADEMEDGKQLAKARGCTFCHGLSGNTGGEADPPTPKIAGQPLAYLVKTMNDYRSGARQADIMNTVMAARSDEEIELLARYYAAQKRY